MAEKQILFNTQMVRAILDGTKTQTRRICKGQPQDGITSPEALGYEPPYHAGDILWVRETWNVNNLRDDGDDCQAGFIYKASEPPDYGFRWAMVTWDKYEKYEQSMSAYFEGWRPSIHMPKEAARIFLRVTGIRAERLQNITIEEIKAEGLTSAAVHAGDKEIAFAEFKLLWSSTIKTVDIPRYGWDANPWVWVYEFEKMEAQHG